MLATQIDVLPTTLANTVWVTMREVNSYNRLLTFRNLSTSQLSIAIEESLDGGVSWTTYGTSFNLAIGEIISKPVLSTGMIRVSGSGETNAKGVMVGYARIFSDATYIWQSPVV